MAETENTTAGIFKVSGFELKILMLRLAVHDLETPIFEVNQIVVFDLENLLHNTDFSSDFRFRY